MGEAKDKKEYREKYGSGWVRMGRATVNVVALITMPLWVGFAVWYVLARYDQEDLADYLGGRRWLMER